MVVWENEWAEVGNDVHDLGAQYDDAMYMKFQRWYEGYTREVVPCF